MGADILRTDAFAARFIRSAHVCLYSCMCVLVFLTKLAFTFTPRLNFGIIARSRHLCVSTREAPLLGVAARAAAARLFVEQVVLARSICVGSSFSGASICAKEV